MFKDYDSKTHHINTMLFHITLKDKMILSEHKINILIYLKQTICIHDIILELF